MNNVNYVNTNALHPAINATLLMLCLQIALQIRMITEISVTEGALRRTNWRLVFAGLLLAALAAGFFIWMLDLAPHSTDPKELLRIAGMISGGGAGLALVLILIGLIGTKRR